MLVFNKKQYFKIIILNLKKNIKDFILVLLELGKIRITTAVSFTALLGDVLANGNLSYKSIFVFFGTFLLSLGSSSINQIQEYKFDAIMNRTKNRPIPTSKIDRTTAFYISIILCSLGMYILVEFVGLIPFIFGLITLILYNLIYTPMKRLSNFAVVPGALVGVFPPFIGWTANGNDYLDPIIVTFGFFIFVWQIPHFWILLLIYKDDYKLADYPIVTDKLSVEQLKKVIFVWVISLCLTSLFFPYFIIDNLYYNKVILLIIIIILSIRLIFQNKILLTNTEVNPKYLFKSINVYVLLVLLIVVLEKVINNVLSR